MEYVRRLADTLRRGRNSYNARRRRTRRSLRLTTIHPLISNCETGPYKYAIEELASHHLKPESTTTTDDKIEAIASIGHLSWTGGMEVAEYTGEFYLPILVCMLKDETTSQELKLQIVKSTSEICCGIKANQILARELDLIPTLINYFHGTICEETKKWCLHTLFYLLCNNIENQRQALGNVRFKACVLQGLEENWDDWDYNEAFELDIMTSVTTRRVHI